MSDELPPLPSAAVGSAGLRLYDADHMRAYARAAVEQRTRERDEAVAMLRRIRASSVIDATDGEYWRLAIDAVLKRREG